MTKTKAKTTAKPSSRPQKAALPSGRPSAPRPASKSRDAEPTTKKKPANTHAWVKRPAKGQYEVDPKDANTVNALQAKLTEIREYKKLLARDGMFPDEADKKRESDIIIQLIRIEKGLPPIKPAKKPKKRVKKVKVKMDKRGNRLDGGED